MADIIHLLPDSIANQIAAGEVIQRPASVVKELVENALDAGATEIRLFVKEAGRNLIQVIDNGSGMSETDARMAFERHATSKISKADDLFSLHTMGFRGEALPSIAAVSQVELRTRRRGAELGTRLLISASAVEETEAVACDEGSNFSVKNLFFNVPARRKFLKSNETEFRNILTEFERVVLVNPKVAFSLYRDGTEVFNLPPAGLRQRILNVCGKNINQKLLPLDVDTALVTVSGFVGRPDATRKRNCLQYFFVNGRFMKHPYFHRAVMAAYEPLVPAGEMPDYFIYFSIDPAAIDVNIHPTKTEIKFENEPAIWQILSAVVRETLAKSSTVPSIDFDTEGSIDIPVYTPRKGMPAPPTVQVDKSYNPFRSSAPSAKPTPKEFDWAKLYRNFEADRSTNTPVPPGEKQEGKEGRPSAEEQSPFPLGEEVGGEAVQFKNRYLLAALKSGLGIIDQRRAHIRVLFDRYFASIQNHKGVSQRLLFPDAVDFPPAEARFIESRRDELHYAGFSLSPLGNNTFAVNGVPEGLEKANITELLHDVVGSALEAGASVQENVARAIALSMAKAAAIPYGKKLSADEINALLSALFASSSPSYTPDGKLILYLLSDEELERRFR
ncbi:MAG: DNA mismatch repair endonuclease MutL [Tannerella sp.]|jgi:DNA mismatch repair protein MutL|nr:DNA mismatch repair endonuclease MutL [Tannerella sp.]